MSPARCAAVTGASGYLGAQITRALEARGWKVIRLVRSPMSNAADERPFDLASPLTPGVREALQQSQLLIHTAYDLKATSAAEIHRINVEGSRLLLQAARESNVTRILVLSSMSAYAGTTQLYGRAKLEIEAITHLVGGCALRPGLVYGDHAGGMAGALRKLARLPIIPLVAGDPQLYMVQDEDVTSAVAVLAEAPVLPASVISIAYPQPVALRQIIESAAPDAGRKPRFITVPWQPLYLALRASEAARVPLPFRADSLLGLVRRAPYPENVSLLAELGVTLKPYEARG